MRVILAHCMWFDHSCVRFRHAQEWFIHAELWFRHVWMWLRQERVWFTHARVEFQLDTCDFKTNQLKLTSDHQKNPDWVLNSGYTTSTSVIFTLMRVLFTLMSVILTYYVLKYFICINLSYRYMSAASMRAKSTLCADIWYIESTLCADCNRTITACRFNSYVSALKKLP
jgi:hypothetical protein